LSEGLSRRRLKMLRMLARGSSPSVVVETLSKEYNCSTAAICSDYDRLHVWAHSVCKDMESLALITRNNGKQQLATEDKSVKTEALKVTVEQIGLVQELGLLGRSGLKIKEKLSMVTPFEADPMLREVLLESIVKQKAEKVERDAAKTSDA